ncbi:MAG: response regulator [Pseudomonadota bacterium]|nr:response regulator [Pseudomonadota bacterium]
MSVRHWPIRTRAVLLATVPVIITVMILTGLHLNMRWADADARSLAIQNLVSESLAAAAEYPLMSGNYESLLPLLEAALQEEDIVRVRILDPSGRALVDRSDTQLSLMRLDDLEQRVSHLSREVIDYNDFAGDEGSVKTMPLGTVEVTTTTHWRHLRAVQMLWQALGYGLAAAILAGLTGRYIALMIVRPLERLTDFTTALADGAFWTRIQETDGAELGQLQRSGNRLAQSLDEAHARQQEFTQRLLEEQSRAASASEAKSRFLAMMSHELRTPLNGAAGLVELMSADMPEQVFLQHQAAVSESLHTLRQLLDDIMVIADSDSGGATSTPEQCVLGEYLMPLMQDVSRRAQRKGLSFISDLTPELRSAALLMQPAAVRQILTHLLDNALKFTDEGMVSMALSMTATSQYGHEHQQAALLIEVSDSGVGIPESAHRLVLEPFYQLQTEASREFDGAGLGLTIVHQLVRRLSGELQFQPRAGGGTCVRVTIPLPPEARLAAESPEPDWQQRALTLLIVEDNEVNLKVAEKMLQRLLPQASLIVASRGEEAITRIQQQAFDLVLMDCQMPGMDGFEASQRLRQEANYEGVIVACTANTTDQIEERCLASGMNDYLAKPLSLERLNYVLSRWLA